MPTPSLDLFTDLHRSKVLRAKNFFSSMPVTRSHTIAEASQLSFRHKYADGKLEELAKPPTPWFDDSRRLVRVVADKEQLTVLNAMYQLSRSRSLVKQDFLRTAAETGL